MKPFIKWSASQVDTYQTCNRKWWFNKILGLEVPQHPSAAIGSAVHAELEAYLEEKAPADSLGPIARTALPFAPKPGSVYVEESIESLGLTAAGLPALGYIDVLDLKSDPPQVLDWKTTSNFRYAKSEEDLLRNVQMSVYAKATLAMFDKLDLPEPKAVRVTHVAMLTKTPHEARRASALMPLATIHENWRHVEATVAEMKATALLDTPDKVTPSESACHAYGGCPFRDRCNALKATKSIFAGLRSASTTDTNTNDTPSTPETPVSTTSANPSAKSALLARLGVKTKSQQTVPQQTAPVEPAAPVAPVAPVVEAAPVAQVAPATAATTADALMARLRGNLAAPPSAPPVAPPSAVTPPDAPSDAAIAERLAAEAAAPPVEKAPKAPVEKVKAIKTDDASGVRRPRNAAPRLAELGYTEEAIASMDNATMAEILNSGTRVGPRYPDEPVVETATKQEVIEAVETSVKTTLVEAVDTFTDALMNGVPASKTAMDTGYEFINVHTGEVVHRPVVNDEYLAGVKGYEEGYQKGYEHAEQELREAIREEVLASIPEATSVDGLRLYVDCRPLKANGVVELDAFLAPIMSKVAANAKVPHYSMIPYAQGPAQVAALVSTQPPSGIIVADTRLPATNAVLEVLLPYAVEVVRGLR